MGETIKIRTQREGEYVIVKALVRHPMETGIRKDKAGNPIPAHYIEELQAEVGGKIVFSADWGTGIAANPYISFRFKGTAGDKLTFSWRDNKGATDSVVITVK